MPLARQKSGTSRRSQLFVAPVANLKTARSLALDNDLAMQRAQFDLADVTTSGIDLPQSASRA